MKKKKPTIIIITLLAAVFTFLSIQTESLFISHADAARATVKDILKDNKQHDLVTLMNASKDANQVEAAEWSVGRAELTNTGPLWRAIFDDDPIYRLKAYIEITNADGIQTTIVWESWRYGIVLGPVVISLGDGPPGFVIGTLD